MTDQTKTQRTRSFSDAVKEKVPKPGGRVMWRKEYILSESGEPTKFLVLQYFLKRNERVYSGKRIFDVEVMRYLTDAVARNDIELIWRNIRKEIREAIAEQEGKI